MALVNRHILLEYDVPGPRLWHERLVLSHVAGEIYIIATPDRDVYAEELGLLNPDVRTLHVRPAAGILPGDVNAAEVYPLPAWTANDLHNLREEGRRVADEERRAMGGGGGALAAAGAAVAPAVVGGAPVSIKIDPDPEMSGCRDDRIPQIWTRSHWCTQPPCQGQQDCSCWGGWRQRFCSVC